MSNKLKVFLLGFLSICVSSFCAELHVFYKQNGDCFVLVGNGEHRGVYALNNLTTDSYNWMYDPNDSYGISAGQWWKGTSNETSSSLIEKRLYTFWASGVSSRSLDGVEVKRRVIPSGDTGVYGYDPPYIVHGAHSTPSDSPTGLGNHTTWDYCQSLTRFFTPSDIPCTEVPVSAGKDSEGYDLYWVTSGIDWYHARDYNVWSDFTYYGWSGIPGRNGGGGWCHRVVKEFLTEYTKDISLLSMNISNKNSPHEEKSESSFVATVTTGTEGTASTLGECVDGCIRAQPDVKLPGTPEPITKFVYSSQVKKSYLYNRPFGETSYTILGKGAGDVLVGKPDNLTCNFIGISTKDNTSNYVYLLGADVINEWMKDAKCNSDMYIKDSEDLACVAVSDQWWQTGGIVYAYDSKKGKVYSFTRVEGGKSGYPDEINVNFDGRKPDKIGADGFGNLYVLKTELEPKDTSNFGKDGTEVEKHKIFSFNGKDHFVAIYRQKVYKTVYKRPYGLDTNFSKINQRIPLGVNEYEREYITEDNDIKSKKIWTSSLQRTKYDGDGSNIRTELAVINVPTPPEPVNVDAVADCLGPVEQDEYYRFVEAKPDNDDGSYSSTRNIFFIVENAPDFDANGVNYNGSTDDKDGDRAVGCFPNTIKESSIVYHWKIVKTKDQLGRTISPGDEDYVVLDTTGDNILLFPSLLEGEFDVGVKVEYRYYDYTKLKVGALASEKETCLTPNISEGPKVAQAKGRIVRDGYSWEHIKQTWKKPPEDKNGRGIIMTSMDSKDEDGYKPVLSDNDSKLKKTEFVMDGASLCLKVDNNKNKSYRSNISWGMKLRETKANIDKGIDRINILMKDEPPKPDDPNLIDDTLKWSDDFKVTWRSELKKDDETIWSKSLPLKNFNLTLDQLRELMPMPSDPLRYVITAEVYRPYSYKVYVKIPTRKISDTEWEYTNRRSPVVVNISIVGEAEVCVTDNTGPSLYQYNAEENADFRIATGCVMVYADTAGEKYVKNSKTFLKASTGETIADWNPNIGMIFYVCDNNPMANYEGTRVCDNNTKDKYHLKDTNALRASFNKDARKAILHYDTASGIKSKATLIDKKTSKTRDITPVVVKDEAELNSVGLKSSKALSYVKYEIPADCMDEFSDMKDKAKLPYDYANNCSGYTNYRFGLSWIESCNSSYNSLDNKNLVIGLDKEKYFVGNIAIIDNDRPNPFIVARQDRFDNYQPIVPSGVPTNWFPTVMDENSGRKEWYSKDSNHFGKGIKECFSNWKFVPSLTSEPKAETLIFDDEHVLLTDIPVTFTTIVNDNVTSGNDITYNYFVMKDEDGNTNDLPKWDKIDSDKPMIQHVFRTPGKYYVELSIKDNALTWPTAENAINNPSIADEANQERIVRAYFEVKASKLEYRVLERDINKDY